MVYRRTPSVVTRLEDNRARILAAARDLVAEGGWRHAHVATVAEKAGVATGTVYRYFPSKAELFAEVLAIVSRRERDVLAAIVDGDGTPAARLRGAVQAFGKRALQGPPAGARHDRRALRAGDRPGPPRLARGAGRGVRAPDPHRPAAGCVPRLRSAHCRAPAWSAPSWRRWSARWRRKRSPMRDDAQRLIDEIADGCLAIVAKPHKTQAAKIGRTA